MTDVHDKTTRSRNMSAIKGKDTKPELQINICKKKDISVFLTLKKKIRN